MSGRKTKRQTVLIVAAEVGLRAAMARMLQSAGYVVELAESERRARQVAADAAIDLAIVAAAQLGSAGARLARDLRDRVGRVLVIDPHAGPERGAVADPGVFSLAQPLDERELLERVRQALGGAAEERPPAAHRLLRFAGGTLDIDGRGFFADNGREIPLTRAEFALLLALMSSPGRVQSREQLRRSVAGEELDTYERSIDMHVSRLRRKIEPHAKRPRFLVTVAGAGYKFAARVVAATSLPAAPADLESAAPAGPAPRSAPERRLLTMLACSIDGLAAIADEHGPEEVEAAAAALREVCAAVIAQRGGVMTRFIGDGLTAYFGYPDAREDDVGRAIAAGLELAEAVDRVGRDIPGGLGSRVGIATGSAVVGDLSIDPGRDTSAVGGASLLARRLWAAAECGWVVVDESSRRVAGRSFVYRRLSPLRLAGVGPIPAWRVIGEAAHLGRFAARRDRGLTQFTGRAEEIAMLRQLWRRVSAGAGQVVLVTGEGGIGKSRLVHELQKSLAGSVPARLRFFAASLHATSPLFPVIAQIEHAAGFARNDGPETKLAKLRSLPPQPLTEQELGLLAGLLSLPADEPGLRQLSPQRRKERVFAVLLRMLEQLAARHPALVVVEDAQWLDATTLELLALTIERIAHLRLLLVVTARGQFAAHWVDHAQVNRLPVNQLPQKDAEALIVGIAGESAVPPETKRDILARGDGIPLFLEELMRMVLEGGPVRPRPAGAGAATLIPPTLQGPLQARLDRLGAAKQLAQIGAVIGRSFSYELLQLTHGGDNAELDAGIERLVGSRLVFRRGEPPDATYHFKHALVGDAAYGTLPQHRRRELHARIAGALEAHFPEIVASQPELLAHHSAEAGNPERAIHYFVAAAERALAQSATIEAGAHAEAAFALLARLPEDDERRRRELVVQMVRSRVAIATKGHTAPEYAQILLRAKELCEALGDGTTLCLVTYGLWNIAWGAADYRSAREHAATLLRYGERKRIPSCVAFGHFVLGTCLLPTGALRDAGKNVEAALRHRPIELPGGQIITWGGAIVRVSALGTLSDCQFLTGVPREAEATAREMAIEAREVPQLYARAIALNVICRTLALRRNAPELLQPAHEMVELTREQGYPQFAARAMVFRGWALAMTGEAAEGLRLARCGVEAARSIGFVCWLTVHLALLAECQASAGDAPAATATLDEALAFAAATEERVWEAELYRLKAEFRLAAGSAPRQAEELLQKAIATARARGAWLLELRAATGLARLRAARGRRAQARDPLTRALKGCSNTTEAAEISEAKAVLASLG